MVKTAKDKATEEKFKSVKDRIIGWANRSGHKYIQDRTAGIPVKARIDWGRWIADCECGGAEYVDPDETIFFCMSCGNKVTNGRARNVIFPVNIKEVEDKTMANADPAWQCWKEGE
jgi:hypothetical protein